MFGLIVIRIGKTVLNFVQMLQGWNMRRPYRQESWEFIFSSKSKLFEWNFIGGIFEHRKKCRFDFARVLTLIIIIDLINFNVPISMDVILFIIRISEKQRGSPVEKIGWCKD